MKFWEAMKALEEEKKVKISTWPMDAFIYLNSMFRQIRDENEEKFSISGEDFFCDWELYEELLSKEEQFIQAWKDIPKGQGALISVSADIDFQKVSQLLSEALKKQEPEKTYSYLEIIPFLKEGKKFRRKNIWNDNEFLSETGSTLRDQFNRRGGILLEDFEATDW